MLQCSLRRGVRASITFGSLAEQSIGLFLLPQHTILEDHLTGDSSNQNPPYFFWPRHSCLQGESPFPSNKPPSSIPRRWTGNLLTLGLPLLSARTFGTVGGDKDQHPSSSSSFPKGYTSTTGTTSTTSTWLDALPPPWRPFGQLSRLDKPIGTWLLAWPCFWSIALAAPPGGPLDVRLLALFGTGAVLLRGAGCTVNDLWDRDLDRRVARTKTRPLASGALTPLQAVGWLGVQLTAGLGVLVQLNPFSQALGAASLGLVVTYPLMKRITGWPQAFLGLTFNWGALLGWAAVRGSCDLDVVLPLYAGGVAWTLVYDTIYAHQDKIDDASVGIRSTALTFGEHSRQYLSAFSVANIACMAAAGHAAGCGMFYYAGLAAAATHLGWQVATVAFDNPIDCAAKFSSNYWYGLLLFSGMVADRLLQW